MIKIRVRRAFTLIELLVVMAIFAVLAGLTTAAVQKVRERSLRAQCQNNMRQLSLGLQQYHGQQQKFPVGLAFFNIYALTGWEFRILPYIEQDALYQDSVREYETIMTTFKPIARHAAASTIIPTMICPSDDRVKTTHIITLPLESPYTAAMGSYLGVCGTTCQEQNGVFYVDSSVRIPMITDGASNTLLIGERPPSYDLKQGWWYCRGGYVDLQPGDTMIGVRENTGNNNATIARCGLGPLPFQPHRFDDPCAHFQFWSPHPNGANFAFCDGSVRFLNYSANDILPALATRAGGEAVDVP